MESCLAYTVLNEGLLHIAREINILNVVEEEESLPPVRLKEAPVTVSRENARLCGVVTAHNLLQYKLKFYGIQMHEDVRTWLDYLVEVMNEAGV